MNFSTKITPKLLSNFKFLKYFEINKYFSTQFPSKHVLLVVNASVPVYLGCFLISKSVVLQLDLSVQDINFLYHKALKT